MAKLTPGASQGGVETRTNEFDPVDAPKPTTGFTEAPASERPAGAAGAGVGNTRRGIH